LEKPLCGCQKMVGTTRKRKAGPGREYRAVRNGGKAREQSKGGDRIDPFRHARGGNSSKITEAKKWAVEEGITFPETTPRGD